MKTSPDTPEFSFVIPLFHTGEGLAALIDAFRDLSLPETWELVLVDDGSTDGTFDQAQTLMRSFPAPVTLVELARNYGEHAAVLEGCRRARGEFIVTMDDDLQNPVDEAVRLLRHLRDSGAEVVYSRYKTKQHSWLRNAGSWLVNAFATFLLGKPRDLYLSSFRAMSSTLVERIIAYHGPYPYVDGLILGATRRIETLEVRHDPRVHGRSGYTMRGLLRLSMSLLFDFSIMPLRLASVLGIVLCLLGGAALAAVLVEMMLQGARQPGWGSLMAALAVFSGAQLLMLGLIGEYVGRAFLTVSGKPQSIVRTQIRRQTSASPAARRGASLPRLQQCA
ncbi:glycosyltransferase family 2 protein [Brevifollis gellanilyticus]|uniref:Glycosyl transferase n=1 Tax=Brevifollis gellanilyticus TaxID=748831 RepID=A0A512MDB5_9BACT|nr:glycosyltransferase family 2 protein [Brevifollis gellanilyticus]GEP44692.1 glycosyl transferase [Brevifollis gellanilyticus]